MGKVKKKIQISVNWWDWEEITKRCR